MKITQQVHKFGNQTMDITIRLQDEEHRTEMTVTRHEAFGRINHATVNFPSCGAIEVEEAQAFLAQLSKATEIAARLDALAPEAFRIATDWVVECLVAAAVDA